MKMTKKLFFLGSKWEKQVYFFYLNEKALVGAPFA